MAQLESNVELSVCLNDAQRAVDHVGKGRVAHLLSVGQATPFQPGKATLGDDQFATGDYLLSADVDQPTPLTDLAIPFSTVGISNPATASLNMLAVASEEDSLRLWATMPHRNLVNSDLSVSPLSGSCM